MLEINLKIWQLYEKFLGSSMFTLESWVHISLITNW